MIYLFNHMLLFVNNMTVPILIYFFYFQMSEEVGHIYFTYNSKAGTLLRLFFAKQFNSRETETKKVEEIT